MANLKATPKTFAEALEVLNGKHSIRLGNNTYLESFTDGTQTDLIAVRLHSTQVVKFWADGRVTLHTGGYHTVTTKERLNQFIDGRVYQSKYEWFYQGQDTEPLSFAEGMNVASL
jgi:hypothetical protein